MVNPIHISQQPKPSNEDFQSKINELEQQNQNLINRNWINSLQDEKIFRFELLQSLDKLINSIDNLTNKVVELAGNQQ